MNTLLHETAGDIWFHREKDELWWTVSTGEQPEMLMIDDPVFQHGKTRSPSTTSNASLVAEG